MATRRVVTRVDDLDGSAGANTVRFGLDRRDYEIDLTDAHADHLRQSLAPFMSAGRRLTMSGRPTPASTLTPEPPGRDGASTVGAADQPDGTKRDHLPR